LNVFERHRPSGIFGVNRTTQKAVAPHQTVVW
jgi:hypothetical protein